MVTETEVIIHRRNPTRHVYQNQMVKSKAKRLIVKAGRRGAKTVGCAIKAGDVFLDKRRVLYAAPTNEQTEKFWFEVKREFREAIDAGAYKVNESEQYIEKANTENRIKAKTAWNANTLRGDYADLLILDEFQLMDEDAWDEVGAPMLLDNNGDAVFVFTPPSLKSQGVSKAKDPRHASKLFKKAQSDTTGMWEAIHFTSYDNPFISKEALGTITADMSLDSYRREIMAQDDDIEQSWLVHGKFNETLCKVKRFEIPPTWEIYSGHDFGKANPAALFLARVQLPLPSGAPVHMRRGDLVAFHEYAPSGGSIPDHVAAFQAILKGIDPKKTVERSVGGNQTTEDEIRQGYGAHQWQIFAPMEPVTTPAAQMDRVIILEESNKLFMFDDLYMTLSQLANCMWKLEDNTPTNKVDHEERYHLLACLRYIGSYFTPETVGVMQRGPVRYGSHAQQYRVLGKYRMTEET